MFRLFLRHKWIFRDIQGCNRFFISNLIITLMISTITILYPMLLGQMVDDLFYDRNLRHFLGFVLVYIILFFVQQILTVVHENIAIKLKDLFTNQLKKVLYSKTMSSPAMYLSGCSAADLNTIINRDSENVYAFIHDILQKALVSYFFLIVLFFIVLFTNRELAVVIVIFSLLSVFLSDIFKNKFEVIKKEYRYQYQNFLDWTVESLHGMPDVQLTSSEQMSLEIFKKHIYAMLKNKEKARFLELKAERMNVFFTTLFTIAFWFLSSIYVVSRRITIGNFLVIEKYFSSIIDHLNVMKQMKIDYHNHHTSLEKVKELYQLDSEDWSEEYTVSIDTSPFNGSIEIKNVSFGYRDKNVLNHFDETIKNGEFIAIVGANGEGKSTLMGLLVKFFKKQSGTIRFGGVDINNIPSQNLREQISYVQQNTVIFEGTVSDNLKLYNSHATEAQMWDALEKCGLSGLVRAFENGLHTDLQSGERLSGGQKQRFAFCRALLKDTSIVLLDEPTSSLDPHSEQTIINDIRHIFKNKTLVMISHRQAAVRAADRISVLNGGKIIAHGTHDELTARCETYRTLFPETRREM